MSDHVTEWLGAYHDGELSEARVRLVEAHLAECAACQAELDELQALSALLQATPPEGDLLPAERFVANLTLSLPHRSASSHPYRAREIGWWLIPVGLLGAGLFINITLSLSTVVSLTTGAGLLDGILGGFQGNPFQMSWFSTVMNLFGNRLGGLGWEALSALNDANVFIARMAWRFFPQALVAVSYLGWLFAWWLRRRPQPSQNGVNSPHS